MKNMSSIIFSSNNTYFAQKEPIKMKIFENFFECSGQNLSNFLCQFWNDKSIPPQVLYSSSVSWKTIPLYFLAQTIYTLLKRSPVKWKFLRLSSARVKFCLTTYANFETTSRFLSKFFTPFSFMKDNSSVLFSSSNIYFAEKEHIKIKFFGTFKCLGQNSSNSSCQFWNDKSIPLQILHHSSFSWHITPLWILSSYFSYFGLKDPIIIPILRL